MGELSLTMSTSDDFLTVATKEILDEIAGIESILKSVTDNDGVLSNAASFQRHTHKIKGLAPMMGKETLGETAAILDNLFKKIIDGKDFELFALLPLLIIEMKNSMTSQPNNLEELKKKISQL